MLKRISLLFLLALPVFATTASPVPLSSISRTANVVTANCSSACGISPNFGFCISGVTDTSFNICGTAVTGSGTTFTFNQTAANGSSTGGTSLAAKQIIDQGNAVSGNQLTVSYLLWNFATTGLAISNGSSWTGASTAESNAIRAGTTIETRKSITVPITASNAQIQQAMQNDWLATQNALNATIEPGANFGQFCDVVGCNF